LLTARSGRHDRQATLRATLDWSWDLLTPVERAALAQTSVFEGGFTLGAAEAVVCVSASAVETWATDVVQALVEKSLIRRSGGHRFDLLRSVHEYAAQRLRESGEVARQAALRRHWLHFGTLDERSAIADRCIEAENLVAACRRATAALDLDAAATVLIAAWAALNLTGPFKVAIELAQDLYRAAHTHAPRAAMTARWVAGSARYLAGDITGAQADLEAATGSGGTLLLQARAYGALGQLERSLGRLERADELLVAGLAFAHQTGDAGLICRAYNALGTLRLAQGRLDDALHDLRVGLDAARSASDLKQQAALLGNIGVVERRLGRDDSALDHYRQALRMAQDIGDRRFEGNMRSNLGLLHQLQGRSEEALTELQIALNIAQGTGLTRLSANVCSNLGLVHERLQQTALALERHTEAMRLADGLKDEQLAGHSRIYAGRLLSRLGRLQEARATLHTAAELLAQSPDVSVLGLLACANAEVWAGFNDREASLQALHVAEQHARTSAVAPNSELAQELRRISEWLNSH
jgi:tetratricopeptide (TPR) repeat protein